MGKAGKSWVVKCETCVDAGIALFVWLAQMGEMEGLRWRLVLQISLAGSSRTILKASWLWLGSSSAEKLPRVRFLSLEAKTNRYIAFEETF